MGPIFKKSLEEDAAMSDFRIFAAVAIFDYFSVPVISTDTS